MGAEALAARINQSPARAAHLLDLHRHTYPTFWRWAEAAVMYAQLHNALYTVFGWTLDVREDQNPRSLQNYPMQGNGAEMLRLASILTTEAGIAVCAPVHDAILIEAPADELEQAIVTTQTAMTQASRTVLGGFTLRSSVHRVRYPDRFSDSRGSAMWRTVLAVLAEIGCQAAPGTTIARGAVPAVLPVSR
jgi:hypothetical protein